MEPRPPRDQALRDLAAAARAAEVISAAAQLAKPSNHQWVEAVLGPAQDKAADRQATLHHLARLLLDSENASLAEANSDRTADDALLLAVANNAPPPWSERARDALLFIQSRGGYLSRPTSQPRLAGKYELGEPIGHGTSGVVFRARHREDGHSAAVKLLRLDALTKDEVRRFHAEVRIASHLEHPNIVKVLASGVHDDGGLLRPWIATELVEGQPFTEWARDRDRDEVLAAFEILCRAVGHAHQNGLVHQNLKPRNVRVDRDGQPIVLEFGVTRTADLAYTSREVALGGLEAASTRSDVWALGAMLFEALCQQTPIDLTGMTPHQALLAASTAPPRRIEPQCVVAPDLGAVLAKTLNTLPERRYLTAVELAADVRHLLDGTPVSARAPSAWSDVARFARQHSAASLIALLAIIVPTALGSVATVMWQRADTLSEQNEALAQQSYTALVTATKMVSELSERVGDNDRVLAMVREPLAILQSIPSPTPHKWLALKAELKEVEADAVQRIPDWQTAKRLRTEVLAMQSDLDDGTPVRSADLARAMVKLGDVLRLQGNETEGGALYNKAHSLFRKRAELSPNNPDALDDLSWSLERTAQARHLQGDTATAIRIARERLDLADDLLELRDDAKSHHNYAAASCHYLGLLGEWNGDVPDPTAVPAPPRSELARRAVESISVAVAADPARRAFRSLAVLACLRQAQALWKSGQIEPARTEFTDVLRHGQFLVENNPNNPEYHGNLAYAFTCRARMEAHLANYRASCADLAQALTAYQHAGPGCQPHETAAVDAAHEALDIARASGERDLIKTWSDRFQQSLAAALVARPTDIRMRLTEAQWLAQLAPTDQQDHTRALTILNELARLPGITQEPDTADRVHDLLIELGAPSAAQPLKDQLGRPPTDGPAAGTPAAESAATGQSRRGYPPQPKNCP